MEPSHRACASFAGEVVIALAAAAWSRPRGTTVQVVTKEMRDIRPQLALVGDDLWVQG